MRSTQPLAEAGVRTCRLCKVELPLSEYYRRSNGYLRTECKPCMRRKTAAAKRRDPQRFKDHAWAKKLREYGLTPQSYDAILAQQHGRCAICHRANPHPSGVRMNTDHCHDTGVVRGILCIKCNAMLGWVEAVGLDAINDYLTSLPAYSMGE